MISLPLSFVWKVSIREFFLESGRVPLRGFSVTWYKKFPAQNRKPPSCFNALGFLILEFFLSTEGPPHEFFRHCETKIFRQRIVIPPPPLMHKIFWCLKISKTPKVSPKKFFGAVRQKFFNANSWHPTVLPLLQNFFQYPNISETPKVSAAEIFGTRRQKNWDTKSCNPSSPFLCINFSGTRDFLKHRRVP